jgi:spermidine synthase
MSGSLQAITDHRKERGPVSIRQKLWNPNAVVFISSACIMVIELVAGRITAPQIGVSLYTWTSIIGVVLAGISVGNYLGGWLADRVASEGFLGLVFSLASLASLSIPWLAHLVPEIDRPDVPVMIWIVIYIALIFFLPSMVLGCISPIVVKLSLTDLDRSGTTVGKIYAWSSAGSIAGTFATGFFLISWFGTRTVVLLVGGILFLMGFYFLSARGWRWAILLLILVAVALGLLRGNQLLESTCLRETNYFCVKVHEEEIEGRTVLKLILDRLVHSYVDLEDPTWLVYGYEEVYAAVLQPFLKQHPDLHAFFIGGGGYTFPRYLEVLYPESRVDVAEIDPEVTEVAHEMLGLPLDTRIHTYTRDARILVAEGTIRGPYELVIGDAFNDYSVPYHLTTLEFNEAIADMLTDDGLYVVNLVDGFRRGHFLRAYVRTMQRTFDHVAVIPVAEGWEDTVRTTFVIAASQVSLDLSGVPDTDYTPWSEEQLADFLAAEPPLVLSDDYVPVDNLLAPVYQDSES